MAKDLPNKEDKEARKAEEARRIDKNAKGVAQEALDCYRELESENRSSSEVFEIYGYSLAHVLKHSIADEARIIKGLGEKPSKDVEDGILKVSDVKSKHDIPEFESEVGPVE